MQIDWRNRSGKNCVTTVRNQYPCESCWAFAATALVESMIRIEHSIWPVKSEGEIRNGVGKQCGDLGNMGETSLFLSYQGLADPDCFPFGIDYCVYESYQSIFLSPATPGQTLPVSSTSDRCGRVARLKNLDVVNDEAAQVRWLDAVGPLVARLDVFSDFSVYMSGIYSHSSGAVSVGGHYMLIVGFNNDDPNNKYWIAKNSYGAGWGEHGFIRIKFGEGNIGSGGMYGIQNTNPSPWSKRRYRNGCMVESGSGARHCNFELFLIAHGNLQWWYCDNSASQNIWHIVGNVASERFVGIPVVIQSSYNRNYEIAVLNSSGQLEHHYFSQYDRSFHHAKTFGYDFEGVPGFIQSNKTSPGDFEVVIKTKAGNLSHWVRHNAAPWTHEPNKWYEKLTFGNDITHSGPAFIQAHPNDLNYRISRLELGKGDYHLVCVHKSGKMQHWINDLSGWRLFTEFSNDINSPPCMIEGIENCQDELSIGNFELCVAKNGAIENWYFDITAQQWVLINTFGLQVKTVLSLLVSSLNFSLQLIVERTDGHIESYWRNIYQNWHVGVIIT